MNQIYTHEEVIANFQSLIDSRDFGAELRRLGIGAMHVMRRKQMQLEFRGLFAGLWRLALTRSFPEDGLRIFEAYLEACLGNDKTGKKGKNARQHVERSRQYAEMLAQRGDADFFEISRHLLSFLPLPEAVHKHMVLQLALDIRKMYNFIFERMI